MTLPAFELDGLAFGGEHPIRVSEFSPGGPDLSNQDSPVGVDDGVLVGRDYLGASTWGFDMFTNVDDYAEAMELAGQVAARWLRRDVRTTPGAVLPLRYHMAGRWRRVYGRPRRYAGPDGGLLTSMGRAEMTADFLAVDHLFYDDEERSISVGTVPATVGGIIAPIITPITTARRSEMERPGQFEIGGSAPTWPTITIAGPIRDPEVRIGDWHLRLVGNLAYDRSITINTAPWARSATRNDGAHVGGMLHPTVRLGGLALEPGHHEVILTGVDTTGTARATIAWRDAHYSL